MYQSGAGAGVLRESARQYFSVFAILGDGRKVWPKCAVNWQSFSFKLEVYTCQKLNIPTVKHKLAGLVWEHDDVLHVDDHCRVYEILRQDKVRVLVAYENNTPDNGAKDKQAKLQDGLVFVCAIRPDSNLIIISLKIANRQLLVHTYSRTSKQRIH